MTPQQASELLDGDFKTETHPEWVGAVQADFDSFSGAYIRATPGHEALYEAAQEMAETVAELRYEYAVQNTETGAFLREESDGIVISTSDPAQADWDMTSEEADSYAAWMTGAELVEYRVVRRLVSTPEVVE